jgi:hypothetical protein
MRRSLASALVCAVAALPAAACGGDDRAGAGGSVSGGSTLRATFVDRDGDGTLERAPGEPLRDRTALGPRAKPGRVLASIGIVTDVHIRDEESPARPSFLDRLGPPFSATFRPQEALTTQVLTAAVRALNAGRPDAVVDNGDLIDNAQRPFRSPGLDAPWYPVAGNHDLLVAGELAGTARTNAVAVGDRVLVRPDESLQVGRTERSLDAGTIDRLLRRGLPGTTRRVAADPQRRELAPAQAVQALRPGAGTRLDYAFDVGPRVRAIVLDTVQRAKGAGGVVTSREIAFLRDELRRSGDRWVLVFTHQPLSRLDGGAPLRALVADDPRVLAALSGDTHRNRIVAEPAPAGGYWQITTSALADYPQQARMLRVRETPGGGAVLETWMVDTAPDPLADTARALAYLDAQGGRPDHDAGRRIDRNVRLYRAAPRR